MDTLAQDPPLEMLSRHKPYRDEREQAVQDHPVRPTPADITRADVAHELALEKARVFHELWLGIHRAAAQYSREDVKTWVRDALVLEFGSEGI